MAVSLKSCDPSYQHWFYKTEIDSRQVPLILLPRGKYLYGNLIGLNRFDVGLAWRFPYDGSWARHFASKHSRIRT